MKRIVTFLVIGIFILSAASVLAETPRGRLTSGLKDLLCGPVEMPDNINQSNSKGTNVSPAFTNKTKTGVERGIARVFSGVWKVATFWYADTKYETAQKNPTK